MALSQIYTAVSGDVITSARWNNEFGNIYSNGTDVAFPATKAVGFEGFTLTLDAADVTTLVSTAAVSFSLTPGNKTGTPAVNGSVLNLASSTFTDNNTAGSGTAATWVGVSIRRPSLAASNASVTTTNAASLYIENSPLAGANETITNPWAIWVDAGNVRFDDDIYWLSGTAFNGILAHNNSAARTYTFPDADTTLIGTSDTNTLTNKTITTGIFTGNNTFTTVAPAIPTAQALYEDSIIKGWVVFDAAGVISDDINVSSVTDNGVGTWTVNWATAFANANYAVSCKHTYSGAGGLLGSAVHGNTPPTTTTCNILLIDTGGTPQDPSGTTARIHVMAIGNN